MQSQNLTAAGVAQLWQRGWFPRAGGTSITIRCSDAHGLKKTDTVGEVRDVGVAHDPTSGTISTPATLALYPSLLHVRGARTAPTAAQVAAEIERIADNALQITQHINALTSAPKLRDAIVRLDAALRQIHRATAEAGPQIGPLVARLRRAADDLDGTAQSADRLMNGTAAQRQVTSTVQEISQAARAIRSLADYLDRHPGALIRGRGAQAP